MEVEHGLVRFIRFLGCTVERMKYENSIGFELPTKPGQMGEGGVCTEPVVGVIGPDTELTGGKNEPLAKKLLAERASADHREVGNR